eukprot:g2388.t1
MSRSVEMIKKAARSLMRKRNFEEDRVIMSFAKSGDWKKLREVLESSFLEYYEDAWTDVSDLTSVHFAAALGYVRLVRLLIHRCGVDVNAVDVFYHTALHFAAEEGHADVVRVLIENGADVNALERQERTALHLAVEEGHLEVAKRLIENGARINASDGERCWTPLHLAIIRDHFDVAKLLLRKGADVNAVDKGKRSPLFISSWRANLNFTLYLLCFGATFDKKALEISSDFLQPIHKGLKSIRARKIIRNNFMDPQGRKFLWSLAFILTKAYGGATAYKIYYAVHPFITYHGMFMGPGYEVGDTSNSKRRLRMAYTRMRGKKYIT